MKKIFCLFALVLFLSVSFSALAQEPPEYRLIEANIQKATFDLLLQQQYVTVASNAAICAFDIATNTAGVGFLPDDVDYPVLLTVKNNHATNMPVYVPYDTVGTSGIVIPTATAAILLDYSGSPVKNGKAFSVILYQDPQISIGAINGSGARVDSEFIFEVWGRSEIDY